jgi:predicted metal-binding protein
VKITLCITCPQGRGDLAETLARALAEAGLTAQIATTDCMSGCTRPLTLAFRAPGKMAYLFGDLTAADLPDLVTFATLYAAAPDGTLADARPLGALRTKAIARIPG